MEGLTEEQRAVKANLDALVGLSWKPWGTGWKTDSKLVGDRVFHGLVRSVGGGRFLATLRIGKAWEAKGEEWSAIGESEVEALLDVAAHVRVYALTILEVVLEPSRRRVETPPTSPTPRRTVEEKKGRLVREGEEP